MRNKTKLSLLIVKKIHVKCMDFCFKWLSLTKNSNYDILLNMEWVTTKFNYDVSKSFKDNYLTPGCSLGHFVFEKCPTAFLDCAKELLLQDKRQCRCCIVEINREIEEAFEKTLKVCPNDLRKSLLARCLFDALFMHEIMLKRGIVKTDNGVTVDVLDKGLQDLCSGDIIRAGEFYLKQNTLEIDRLAGHCREIELVVMLKGTENKFIQQVVNGYIASRTPYAIKVFTDNVALPSYSTAGGQFIERVHDYSSLDINEYIKCTEESTQQN